MTVIDEARARSRGGRMFFRICPILLLLALVAALVTSAHAGGTGAAASALSSAGGSGCASRAEGNAVRDCVAGVLEQLATANSYAPQLSGLLRRAASDVRAATSRAAALLAITACQSVISTAIQQAKAAGLARFGGFGSTEGLGHITRVLSLAARLIQSKG